MAGSEFGDMLKEKWLEMVEESKKNIDDIVARILTLWRIGRFQVFSSCEKKRKERKKEEIIYLLLCIFPNFLSSIWCIDRYTPCLPQSAFVFQDDFVFQRLTTRMAVSPDGVRTQPMGIKMTKCRACRFSLKRSRECAGSLNLRLKCSRECVNTSYIQYVVVPMSDLA
jgi:hypothetical protein